jgi:hypothetical protein
LKAITTILFTLLLLPAAASADPITGYSAEGPSQIEWTSVSWLDDFLSSGIDLTTPVENPNVFDIGLTDESNTWNAPPLQLGVWNGPHDKGGIDYDRGNGNSNNNDQITPVPEPATLLLFGTGAVALAARRRRRQSGNSISEAHA